MISTETGLRASQEALLHLQSALADLEREKGKYHPANFALMAEPIQDEIQKIGSEIAEYERRRTAGQSNGDPRGLVNRRDMKSLRPFSTNANYLAELRSLLALHRLWVEGKGESPEADAIRDATDGPWHALSEVERKRLRGLSDDLNWICDYRPDEPIKEMNPQAQLKLVEANEAWQRGEWDRTLEILRRWGHHISPALLAYLRGSVWFAAGDAEPAGVFFEHAVRLDSTNANFRISFMNALLETDFARAVAEAENVIAAAEDNDPAVVVHSASAVVSAVIESPTGVAASTYARLLPLLKRAVERLAQESDSNRLPLLAGLSLVALCYENLGDTSNALAHFSRILQIDPNDTEALSRRGRLLFGTNPSARADFELAIHLGSSDVWPYFFLAHDYLSTGQFDECRSICERGLRKQATDRVRSELFECLAISQAALEYPTSVVRNSFESAFRADPSNDRARRNLGIFDRWLASHAPETKPWETRAASTLRSFAQEEMRQRNGNARLRERVSAQA